MVNISEFFPRLIPNVMGCSEPLAQQALVDAAITFCDQSLAVTVDLDPVTIPVGSTAIELETPDQTTVAQVLYAWYDKKVLNAVPYGQFTDIYRPNATPTDYTVEYLDEVANLRVYPAPSVAVPNGLVVRVALRPTRAATQLHDILFQRYVDGIVCGAQAILCAIPDQPFTNIDRSVSMGQRARAAANQARADMMFGRVQSSMSVMMRGF